MCGAKEMVLALSITFAIGILLYGCMNGAANNTILLGDEVRTTDRYNDLFNDSFSGRVVDTGDMYIVRDDNGGVREFDRHWLVKHETEEI